MTNKPLWESTRELHHACEKHVVGSALASGSPPKQWYVDWLDCLKQIHSIIDKESDPCINRVNELVDDISNMGNTKPRYNSACEQYCSNLLDNSDLRQGAIYVLTGAHLMGGEIMRRRLQGYPVKHIEWEDRNKALEMLKTYRMKNELADSANACFQALLNIMDEIAS